MSAELGKYAGTVLLAYSVSLVLLISLVVYFLWRDALSKAEVEEVNNTFDA